LIGGQFGSAVTKCAACNWGSTSFKSTLPGVSKNLRGKLRGTANFYEQRVEFTKVTDGKARSQKKISGYSKFRSVSRDRGVRPRGRDD